MKEWLRGRDWAGYRINAAQRQIFEDTAFGPAWKVIPFQVDIPEGIKLDSYRQIRDYIAHDKQE